ncbi:MAG TPA: hypothetical protein VFY92_12350 [Hyphomicrobiaceae bacterium]|nr:hypothetical protein [Hyphomicrobiaceae bacterium]
MTIAPVIGAPDAVAKQLSAQLSEAATKQRVLIATSPSEKADYTVRGYVVAAKEKTGTKVSYIWDVTDGTGKRVNRITGEELAGTTDARDPWAAVTPQIIQSIATKTANQLATWLPTQTLSATASPAAAPVQTASVGPAAKPEATAQPAAYRAPAPAPAAATPAASTAPAATAAVGRDGVSAVVPSVTGAPGDGSTSLTEALQRELQRAGVNVAQAASGSTYRVEGKVKLGPSKDGKQPIQIDWHVKDPQGKQLGTVSQKNEIPEGSLDGSWGKVADAAAGAAAQGILKLLPQAKAGG